MAINYYVRVYCETEGEWKETIQVDTIDDAWVPDGCDGHTLRDFTIYAEEEV